MSNQAAALQPDELAATGVHYIEDPAIEMGNRAADVEWRVSNNGLAGETPEAKEARILQQTALAQPVIDTIAEIQETKRSLGELWYEHSTDNPSVSQRAPESEASQGVKDENQPTEMASQMPEVDAPALFSAVIEEQKERKEAALSRPKWEDYIPQESTPEAESSFEKFLSDFPENIQEHIRYLRKLTEDQSKLLADPQRLEAYRTLQPERYITMHNASVYGYCRRQSELIAKKVSDLRVAAHQRGRSLSTVEQRMINNYQSQAERYSLKASEAITNTEVQKEVERREIVKQAEALRKGFLETEPMKKIIQVVLPRLAEGLPAAFFGEVGGAKSSLARHIAREYLNHEPISVDCGPDIIMSTLFGKTGLRATEDGQGSETYEIPGAISQAAEEGRMVIMDEYDTLPARIRTACNGALLWRVGQKVRPFGLDHDIVVKPGFCIVITANLRSNRYDREKLDLSTIDRFEPNGAGIFEIHYPDSDVVPGGDQAPTENIKLAIAALTDEKGEVRMPPGMVEPGMKDANPVTRLIQFVNAAHMIQRFFSDPTAVSGHEAMITDSQHLTRSRQQGKPVLESAVLSPRGMLGILRNLAISGESTTLSQELARWVAMQPSEMDRKIVSTVLASRGLLLGIRERDLKIPEGTLRQFYSGAGSP